MEILFTKAQITAIEEEASSNLAFYLDTRVISGEATEISILTISEKHQLIFTEGNTHTGFRHLKDRHAQFSYEHYWQKTPDGYRLDAPSKFHPGMMPIIDYVKIADTIFLPENKNVTKNNHPDQFDKYSGTYSYQSGPDEKYHLLTYKDTRIVHTLFPDKKRHNRKSRVKLGRGVVTTSFKFPEGHNDLVLPYTDSSGKTAYSILIRRYFPQEIEHRFIQKHDNTGEPTDLFLIYESQLSGFERFDHEDTNYFQHGDISEYEQLISEIDQIYKQGKWAMND
ncbi:hypothetical protein [Mucilaginibacter kameinonensis]|uniref:hypothetical protein n=1 Tax=Mucilaginibacter kameinonensis TaxID=452286 RepID=UPI000EF76370|nr:hypothetical protein [Mucilaginibacter kameinonensis]